VIEAVSEAMVALGRTLGATREPPNTSPALQGRDWPALARARGHPKRCASLLGAVSLRFNFDFGERDDEGGWVG